MVNRWEIHLREPFYSIAYGKLSEMETQEEHMYFFVWRTPKKNHEAMMQICNQAHKMHGKYDERLEFFQLANTDTFEGFNSIAKTVSSSQDEEVWLELVFFRDSKHHDEVVASMLKDKSAGQTFKQFMDLISPGSCIEGRFNRLIV